MTCAIIYLNQIFRVYIYLDQSILTLDPDNFFILDPNLNEIFINLGPNLYLIFQSLDLDPGLETLHLEFISRSRFS